MKVSPSIIAADLSILGASVGRFNPETVDLLHMDVMDGHFVPNMTYGPGYIKNLSKHTDIPFDIHLMIETPERTIDQYIELMPWAITIHYETTYFPLRALAKVREAGIRAGITLNPATPVEHLFDLLPEVDMVLIMSVDPGFYGQSFMPSALPRIKKVSDFRREHNLNDLLIQVDGGVNAKNIKSIAEAGADIVVAGSAAFSSGDVNNAVKKLKQAAQ